MEPPAPETEKRVATSRAAMARIALACGLVAAAVVWINRDNLAQFGILRGRYQPLADWFAGGPPPPSWTCPPWGYPWLLHLFSMPQLLVLQGALAVATMVALWALLARTTRSPRLLGFLCIAAVPWWVLASLKLADYWSAAFGVLGVLGLVRVAQTGAWRWVIAAGAAFGLSLAFRSEFFGIVLAIPVGLAIVSRDMLRMRWPSLAGVVAITIALAVPWGLFRVHHGAPFGILSSNLGLGAYNALGFPGNAWGIVPGDQLRAEEVEAALGPGVATTSYEGDRWLVDQMLERMRERPDEYVRKVLHLFRASLTYGFHGISVEPFLQEGDARRYEVLKEQLKQRAGARVNPLDVAEFRRSGEWQDDFSLRDVPPRLWAMAALPIANSLLSLVYLLGVIAASAWLVATDRARLARPEVAIPFVALGTMWAVLCLTQWEPRQANVLYPLGIPLWIAGAESLRSFISRTS